MEFLSSPSQISDLLGQISGNRPFSLDVPCGGGLYTNRGERPKLDIEDGEAVPNAFSRLSVSKAPSDARPTSTALKKEEPDS